MYSTIYSLDRKLLVSSHEKVLGIFWENLQVMQDGDIVQVGRSEDILGTNNYMGGVKIFSIPIFCQFLLDLHRHHSSLMSQS